MPFNLGVALIPLALSVYLLIKHKIYAEAAIGVAIVSAITYLLARPVPGVGIAIPPLLPPILAAVVCAGASRVSMRPPWPISPAAWAACWWQTSSISIASANFMPRSLPSVARESRTEYFLPASWPFSWPSLETPFNAECGSFALLFSPSRKIFLIS